MTEVVGFAAQFDPCRVMGAAADKGSRWWNPSFRHSVQRCPSRRRIRIDSLALSHDVPHRRRHIPRPRSCGRLFEGLPRFPPQRLASSLSIFSVTAASITAARSRCMRGWRRSSLSRSSPVAVNWTLKRSGDSGSGFGVAVATYGVCGRTGSGFGELPTLSRRS